MHWTRWMSGAGVILTLGLIALIVKIRRDVRETRRLAQVLHDRTNGIPPADVSGLKETIETQQEATRQHISGVVGSIEGNTAIAKTNTRYVVDAVKRLSEKFGVKPP